MSISFAISAIGGIGIGLLYSYLFKKQTKSLLEGLLGQSTNNNKTMAILRHLFFLISRFLVIIGLIFALYSTGHVDLQVCCIFVVCGFLLSLFMQTKRML
ncbi:hypothetical protein FJ364_03455 [Candidatus Dependentiae bacterium]|nr:hypothetical protein [Candidatus Dependentiae bacterium]